MTTVRSLDEALAHAVSEGKRATLDLRRRLDLANRSLKTAIDHLELALGRPATAQDAPDDDIALFRCSACGRVNRVPLLRVGQKARCGACSHPLQLAPESARGLAETVLRRVVRTVEGHRQRVSDQFRRQEAALDRFNLVFFGRTGVGKSSLVEALSRGDGEGVSQCQSDWTQDVRQVEWRSCRLTDTPGIGGWGRGVGREELESRARKAVETADVVLLCFDTQSQQISEFERVAEWVQAYGKPTLALLNIRNEDWRRPARVPDRSSRRWCSRSVAQHAGHIRDELTNIGLGGTPIIALSAKRALFARASEPFRGPDEPAFRSLHQQHGARKIERWSNLAALEDVLISAIGEDAAGIRVGMLRREVRAELSQVAEQLLALARSSRAATEGLESLIDATLRVVGYPPADVEDARAAFRDANDIDLLSELERLRGSRFQAASAGELQAYSKQLITARLSLLRTQSLGEAERIIEEAFADGHSVPSAEFQRRVFDTKRMETAAREMTADVERFLSRKVNLAARDASTDFEWQARGVRINGGAGSGSKETARWLDIAKVTTSAISTISLFIPTGFVVSLIAGIGSFILGLFSKRTRKKAEKERAQARREALESTRRAVHAAYDKLTVDLTAEVALLAQRALSIVLVEPLRTAVALRRAWQELELGAAAVHETGRTIETSDPQAILRTALRRVEDARLPGDPAAPRKLWLGEDWIDDPEGLRGDGAAELEDAPRHMPPADDVATTRRLRATLLAVSCPPASAADEWLSEARQVLSSHLRARSVLQRIEQVAGSLPRVHVVGDYNAGKSSLIRRLLADAGQEVPQDLAVGAAPTTTHAREYTWEGLLLVDTPGFQSGRSDDAEEALRALADAAVVLYVMQPNLMTGTPVQIGPLFHDDREAGRISKLGRTLFVINRSDELGADPLESPAELSRIRERKMEELLMAMSARSIAVDRRQIMFVASDPFGLAGARGKWATTSFDAHRSWDGVTALSKALTSAAALRHRQWVDVGVLHGAAARMASLARSVFAEEEIIEKREAWIEGTWTAFQEAADGASRLSGAIAGEFERLVRDHAFGLLSDVLGAATDEEIEVQTRRLQKWWEEQGFRDEVERWQDQTSTEVNAWFARAEEALGRRLASVEFRRIFPEIASELPGDELTARPVRLSQFLSFMKGGAKAFSKREFLYGVVKALGGKFAPWGVVKWTARLATMAKVLGPIGLGVDIVDLLRHRKAEEAREKGRQEALRWVQDSTSRVIEELLRKVDHESTGPVAYVEALEGRLRSAATQFETEAASLRAEREQLAAERASYERLLRLAEKKLRANETEAGHG